MQMRNWYEYKCHQEQPRRWEFGANKSVTWNFHIYIGIWCEYKYHQEQSYRWEFDANKSAIQDNHVGKHQKYITGVCFFLLGKSAVIIDYSKVIYCFRICKNVLLLTLPKESETDLLLLVLYFKTRRLNWFTVANNLVKLFYRPDTNEHMTFLHIRI